MSNHILITNVLYYSLFRKQLFNDENKINKYFPKNTFGIFSTIRRSRKIKKYPIDIHGCIGYWDNTFITLKNKELYRHLLRVSYDSVWNDTRNTFFEPIQNDPNSFLELDFMINPIYSINKHDGFINKLNISFTNKHFGIIIQSKDKTLKATYLPNVFFNISWQEMIISIKNKANIISDDYELYAYKIIQIKSTFISLLTDELFSFFSISQFSRLLIDNMDKKKNNFPIFYSCKDNILQWNSNDQVRNISILNDLFQYIHLYPNISNKKELENIKNIIFSILNNIEKYSSQSLSFLGNIYSMFKIKNDSFCKKLMEDFSDAENDFEKPEIYIGLVKSGCKINNMDYLLTYTSNDSIFKMNWIIQATHSIHKPLSKKLIKLLENKINEII
jgi:hypothetical protein